MFRREVEGNPVALIAEKGLTGFHRLQDATFAFDPEIVIDPAMPGNNSDDVLRQVGVQVIGDDFPFCRGRFAGNEVIEESREVVLRAAGPDPARYLSCGHIEGGDQGLRAMADVFVFAPFHRPRPHGQRWGGALKRLDTRHLINRDRTNPCLRPLLRGAVDLADIDAFLVKLRIRLDRQPIADAMRLQVRLF